MQKIPKFDITAPRNRLLELCISIADIDGNIYNLQSAESLVFGVKSNPDSSDYDIKKVLTADDETESGYLLVLSTSDTDLPAGRYYYDIALRTADGELVQIIDTSRFEITESVVQSE